MEVFIGVLVVLTLVAVALYNGLVQKRNLVKNSYSQIDVQLKRRYDLIPNLVETAKAYMTHERESLEAVIKARNSAASIADALSKNGASGDLMKKLNVAEGLLSQTMSKFVALAEAYPDLKANFTMSQLMEELTSTENKVSFARQAYNDSVMEFNNARETFPSSMLANSFGFAPANSFEITSPEEKNTVKVKF